MFNHCGAGFLYAWSLSSLNRGSLNRDLDPKRKYKEVFISWGGQESKVYGVEVSTEEYLAYSTEQNEKLRLEEKVADYDGNYDLALRDYAEEFKTSR